MSNCFFASSNIIDDIEHLLHAWNNLNSTPGTNQLFNVVLYLPLQMVGSTSVLYEQCDFKNYINTVSDLLSADWGSVANRVVSLAVDGGLNYQDYTN